MNMKKRTYRITLTEEALGMSPASPEIHERFIASKAPDAATREEEVAAQGVEEVVEKSVTAFPKENGVPFLWDYQLKGLFKDCCGMLTRAKGTKSSGLKAYRKIIDGLIFVGPRRILFKIPEGEKLGKCQRPLRASTAQGDVVALAHSETVPAGTTLEFEVSWFPLKADGAKDLGDVIDDWLEYGALRGLGQWRNSGKGRYTFEKIG